MRKLQKTFRLNLDSDNSKYFYTEFGWFSGEPFNIFKIQVGEVIVDCGIITFLSIQFLYLCFGIGVSF